MKRISCGFSVLLFVLTLLCGCKNSAVGTVSLNESTSVSSVESMSDYKKDTSLSESGTETVSSGLSQSVSAESEKSDSGSKAASNTASEKNKNSSSVKSEVKDKPSISSQKTQSTDTKKAYTCTFSIECATILDNIEDLTKGKAKLVPENGIIFAPQKVTFYEGESVYDVLKRICKENKIHLEASFTPMYGSTYVEGINNLYEFDCGNGSGWMYRVNGWYPNYGCSKYMLKDGETVEWKYTCNLGDDIGGGTAVAG